jgi:DNA processing protein
MNSGGTAMTVDDEIVLGRAYLSRVGEPGAVPLWMFVDRVGPVEAAAAIRAERAPEQVLAATAARRALADPEADLAAAERHGIRLVVPESNDWPHFAMSALERTGAARAAEYRSGTQGQDEAGEPVPPLALWVRGSGDLAALGTRSAGVVGARAATAYGDHVTAEFGFGLAAQGVAVVSGGAYGIDAAAHRGALAADGVTIAVSAGGLDRPYPAGNANLFERIAANGLLISESPPGCAPQRHRFLSRNRLIAALSTGVVVVEAATRSGAANTANHARRLGRPVMAVPGPVTSAMSAGCHALLREGSAVLVTSVEEVLQHVGPMGAGLARPASTDSSSGEDLRGRLDDLDPTARRVFEGLAPRRYATPEAISARTGVGVLDVVRTLPTLDLAGLIEAGDGGYRIAAAVRPTAAHRR